MNYGITVEVCNQERGAGSGNETRGGRWGWRSIRWDDKSGWRRRWRKGQRRKHNKKRRRRGTIEARKSRTRKQEEQDEGTYDEEHNARVDEEEEEEEDNDDEEDEEYRLPWSRLGRHKIPLMRALAETSFWFSDQLNKQVQCATVMDPSCRRPPMPPPWRPCREPCVSALDLRPSSSATCPPADGSTQHRKYHKQKYLRQPLEGVPQTV